MACIMMWCYILFFSMFRLMFDILISICILEAIQIITMISQLIFAWGTRIFLKLWTCQSMLDLSHDIVLPVYTSKFLIMLFLSTYLHVIYCPWIHCFHLCSNWRYVPDEKNQLKLQINAQNCLHCKVIPWTISWNSI